MSMQILRFERFLSHFPSFFSENDQLEKWQKNCENKDSLRQIKFSDEMHWSDK